MRAIIICETSGAMRERFLGRGWDAVSVDILPSDTPSPHHVVGDGLAYLQAQPTNSADVIILHPPCTYLSVSGQHWTVRGHRDPQLTVDAIRFAEALWDEARRVGTVVVLENPVSVLATRSKLGRPTQYVQPYEFGHDASKKTALWIHDKRGSDMRIQKDPSLFVEPRIIEYKGRPARRWGNQSPCGAQSLPPSKDRWKIRSKTYSGIADAIVNQLGFWLESRIESDWQGEVGAV